MSSYKALDLFGSGPHRFAAEFQGSLVVPLLRLGNQAAGSGWLGLEEYTLVVTGRLIASSQSGLWSLRDAIVAQLIDPPTAGTLIDSTGRSHASMSFIGFEEGDRVDRGRVWSLAYTARFRRFKTTP